MSNVFGQNQTGKYYTGEYYESIKPKIENEEYEQSKIGSIGGSYNEQKIYDSSPATGGRVPRSYTFDQVPEIRSYMKYSCFNYLGYDPLRDNDTIYYRNTNIFERWKMILICLFN